MEIKSILDNIVKQKLNELNKHGYILSGHNGPYYDPETPVRNTAHFATTFSYYYQLTKEKKYYEAVKKCGNFLISKEARPTGSVFFCRNNPKKDFCNGTIGAAWVIEGLVSAYKTTKEEKYIEVAKEVFLLFPFDEKYNLWQVVDVNGSIKGLDMTFNHQLWFAAAGVQLLSIVEDNNIRRTCNLFFNNIERVFSTYNSGLVRHRIFSTEHPSDRIKNFLIKTRESYNKITLGKSMEYKENGYHLFNLYAFALIKDHGYELDLFQKEPFINALNYCVSDSLYYWLEKKEVKYDINKMPKVKNTQFNIYGYSYNAPGFELPYIYKLFQERIPGKNKFVASIVKKQIELTFNQDKMSFSDNNDDENTLNARLYELIRSLSTSERNKYCSASPSISSWT